MVLGTQLRGAQCAGTVRLDGDLAERQIQEAQSENVQAGDESEQKGVCQGLWLDGREQWGAWGHFLNARPAAVPSAWSSLLI